MIEKDGQICWTEHWWDLYPMLSNYHDLPTWNLLHLVHADIKWPNPRSDSFAQTQFIKALDSKLIGQVSVDITRPWLIRQNLGDLASTLKPTDFCDAFFAGPYQNCAFYKYIGPALDNRMRQRAKALEKQGHWKMVDMSVPVAEVAEVVGNVIAVKFGR